MPKNTYYIKNEIQKPVETVYELNENNWWQEYRNQVSKLSPVARTKIVKRYGSDYLSERTLNHDIALTQMYGPGFWDDIKDVVKPIAKGALIVASVFPPTAPIAAPITLSVAVAGVATYGIGHIADNEDFKEVGMDLMEIGHSSLESQGDLKKSGADKVASYHYNRLKK